MAKKITIHIKKAQPDQDPVHVLNGDEVTFHSHVKDSDLDFPCGLGFGSKEHVSAENDGNHHSVKACKGAYKYTITMAGQQPNDPMIIVDDDPVLDGDDLDRQRRLGGPSAKEIADAIETLAKESITAIQQAATQQASKAEARLFFPNGITLIDVIIDVAGIKAEVKISGPPNNS
jgi:hypothetical protein